MQIARYRSRYTVRSVMSDGLSGEFTPYSLTRMLPSTTEIVSLLNRYESRHPARASVAQEIRLFVETIPDCAQRSHLAGHLTGSAWVVNQASTAALLLHHKKLNRWLQPGGHADGVLNLLKVAMTEASEESGLTDLSPVDGEIFDVDIHEIPERGGVPRHLHYDIRFLLRAETDALPQRNHESNEIVWVPFEEISTLTNEESVLRMNRLFVEFMREVRESKP